LTTNAESNDSELSRNASILTVGRRKEGTRVCGDGGADFRVESEDCLPFRGGESGARAYGFQIRSR